MQIKPFDAKSSDITSIISGFSAMGGTARELHAGCRLALEMIKDDECTRLLSISGPAVAIGLKKLFVYSVNKGWFGTIITSGANIVHDLVDAHGGRHYLAQPGESDAFFRKKNFGRIGNIVIDMNDFAKVERTLTKVLAPLNGQQIGISELLDAIGAQLPKGSLLRACHDKKVKVYSPGFQDSMLGLHLMFARKKPVIDAISDMPSLANKIYDSKRIGALMLGGGIPKHFAMGSTVLKEGLDYAVNITTGVEYDSSLSGAGLSEGISWKKVKGRYATIHGDYSILFPLLYTYLAANVKGPNVKMS